MLKKLKNAIYNKKIVKVLEDVKFDNFAYCGAIEYPLFVKESKKNNENEIFTPKTEESFKLAFSKLKKRFFKKNAYLSVKERLVDYCNYFKFNEEIITYCLNIYKTKNDMIISEQTKNI